MLVLLTVAVFAQTVRFEFVNRDDPYYIVNDPLTSAGITAEGLRALVTRAHLGNWHPLTSLSFILDAEWFGLNPGGFHFTNLVFHALNAVLLYVVLFRCTQRRGPAFFVAALFAIHPLHVESVAWISQRKDVLSAFFMFATLLAYERYARRPGIARFLPVMGAFALGLLAKGMLVTLPFVLLLLDYWPLERWRPRRAEGRYPTATLANLVIEKFPLFALSAVISLITFRVQSGPDSMTSAESMSLAARLANAVSAYAMYLGQMIWPAGLIAHYPHPGEDIDAMAVAIAAGVLIAITIAAIATRNRWRFVSVGWLWYLGTLLPVIGLVQVGSQSRADRYTYLPLIGIFITIVWSIDALTPNRASARRWAALSGTVIVAAFAVLAFRQAGHWRDSESLWRHNLAFASGNPLPHLGLADALAEKDELVEARAEYARARELSQSDAQAFWAEQGLGRLEFRENRFEVAAQHYTASARMNPNSSASQLYAGKSLLELGRAADAKPFLERAVALNSKSPDAHDALGTALGMLDDDARAEEAFRTAIALDPCHAHAHANLGSILARNDRLQEALEAFVTARDCTQSGDEMRARLDEIIQSVKDEMANTQ